MASVSYGARLTALAAQRPDDVALRFVPLEGPHALVTYAALEREANQCARLLAATGVRGDSLVVIGMPTHPKHLVTTMAAWKLGAGVVPINAAAPAAERTGLLEVIRSLRHVVTVGSWSDGHPPDLTLADLEAAADQDDSSLDDAVADPAVTIASGGTTGRPKVTLAASPGITQLDEAGEALVPSGMMRALGLRRGSVQMVCMPLYHVSGFAWTHAALQLGNPLVLVERFHARRVLDAIEQYRVSHSMLVPPILQRLAAEPDIAERDLSSYTAFAHGGAPCPDWLKRRWIELVGATRLYEGYGATEPIGATVVRGDEWLTRPGTVGRPVDCEVRVLSDEGVTLAPGEIGSIYMRPVGVETPQFSYAGGDYAGVTGDGFVSLGDFGSLDADGYLYVADRRVDMIITGGANVYPAEVEAVLSSHPEVAEVAVIGLPDESWGRRVHAVVVPRDNTQPPELPDLAAYCRDRLAPYKLPKSYELAAALPRTEVGKVRRTELLAERTGTSS